MSFVRVLGGPAEHIAEHIGGSVFSTREKEEAKKETFYIEARSDNDLPRTITG